MTQKELTVLMVEPGKHPKVTKLKDDLDSQQKREPRHFLFLSSHPDPFATIYTHSVRFHSPVGDR